MLDVLNFTTIEVWCDSKSTPVRNPQRYMVCGACMGGYCLGMKGVQQTPPCDLQMANAVGIRLGTGGSLGSASPTALHVRACGQW